MRTAATWALAALIGGPVAASVCEVRCLDHGRPVPTVERTEAAPANASTEHQHHHVTTGEASAQRASADTTPHEARARLAVRATNDCCQQLTRVDPVSISSVKPSMTAVTRVLVLPWTPVDVRPLSTMFAVAHALEPPSNTPAQRLSSVLRI